MTTPSDQSAAQADTAGADVGDSLTALLEAEGRLGPTELVRVFGEVLDDLERAHADARLHRDITSARIVRQDGRFVLTGYGAGKLGNVRYMAPERCQGAVADARSDIYSLGVALYEAATGRLPFESELRHECIDAQVNRPPDPPRLVNSDISPELERVILRALSKNPAGRYQTASEFRAALIQAVGAPVSIRQEAAEREAPWVESTGSAEPELRRRFRLGVLVVPAALLVAAAAFFFLRGGQMLGGSRMPGLLGIPVAAAESRLARLNVGGVAVEEVPDTLPAGTVVGQDPGQGQTVSPSTAVVLQVSSGSAGFPDLIGVDADDAIARVRRLGMEPAVETIHSDAHATGKVVSTRPRAGEVVETAGRVTVVVSAGRATCPKCGARREPQARFCTKCGFKF
ncbi:MAG: PASTA domain-containing protein [bacterium]